MLRQHCTPRLMARSRAGCRVPRAVSQPSASSRLSTEGRRCSRSKGRTREVHRARRLRPRSGSVRRTAAPAGEAHRRRFSPSEPPGGRAVFLPAATSLPANRVPPPPPGRRLRPTHAGAAEASRLHQGDADAHLGRPARPRQSPRSAAQHQQLVRGRRHGSATARPPARRRPGPAPESAAPRLGLRRAFIVQVQRAGEARP